MSLNLLQKNTTDVPLVEDLLAKGLKLTDKARDILNNSTSLKEMGLIIFMDRYAIKAKRDDFEIGDLVVAISKDHPKYPKKDLGIIVSEDEHNFQIQMVTGVYKDDVPMSISKLQCDKPLESIYDAYTRVGKAVASKESEPSKWQAKFTEELLKGHIQPAGRIMAGANVDETGKYTSNLTLYNCYVIPSPGDSRASIVKDTLYQMVEIFSRGGGVGINLSTLRPRYAYIRGVNGKSSGSVSWGNLYSNATGLIEQGGSRRGALMLMLADWHPDIEEFIASKHKIGFLDNANISVLISDPFMKAVKEDAIWPLEFPDLDDTETKRLYDTEWDGDLFNWKKKGYKTHVYKNVKARDMWQKLIQSAWKSAEPGIVFIDHYNNMSNSWYYNPLICTNPCGEQGLPAWGVCNLGHLALNNFVVKTGEDEIGPLYDFDWDALKDATSTLVRFLDDVIDLTPYIFEENKQNQLSERRVGCGTLGLAEVLIRLRLKIGDKEATDFVDKLYRTIAVNAYMASVDLAKEKGAFDKFEVDKFLESGFMKGMPEDVRTAVKEFGIRNVTLTTQAPTGTVGSMVGTSTGIEPFYAFKYFQQSRLGFHEVEIDLVKEYAKKEDGSLQDFFVSAMDMGPEDHIDLQATIQRWTDSSISKTANVPSDFTVDQTMKLYEYAFDTGCKGVTIYRDGSRDEQILSTDKSAEEKNAEHKPTLAQADVPKEDLESVEIVYGSEVGETCPICKKGIMVKVGGCTECNAGCGFKGGCDMK
ncbi:adenosylcobalamin-dependent ribonucleoside-diphosphate reductase [Candidatus Woesearchaeota archaeon]|nr:adenosylcobalamin-dependent ribonucleoside-diphosphate reductase [Candidatus Woesearchaeota archaeon]